MKNLIALSFACIVTTGLAMEHPQHDAPENLLQHRFSIQRLFSMVRTAQTDSGNKAKLYQNATIMWHNTLALFLAAAEQDPNKIDARLATYMETRKTIRAIFGESASVMDSLATQIEDAQWVMRYNTFKKKCGTSENPWPTNEYYFSKDKVEAYRADEFPELRHLLVVGFKTLYVPNLVEVLKQKGEEGLNQTVTTKIHGTYDAINQVLGTNVSYKEFNIMRAFSGVITAQMESFSEES